jgi:hypothetical protein
MEELFNDAGDVGAVWWRNILWPSPELPVLDDTGLSVDADPLFDDCDADGSFACPNFCMVAVVMSRMMNADSSR